MQIKLNEKVRETPEYFACLETCKWLDTKTRWDAENSSMVKTDIPILLHHECIPDEIKHRMFDFQHTVFASTALATVYKLGQYHILRIENWGKGAGKISKKSEMYKNERRHKLSKITLTDEYIQELLSIDEDKFAKLQVIKAYLKKQKEEAKEEAKKKRRAKKAKKLTEKSSKSSKSKQTLSLSTGRKSTTVIETTTEKTSESETKFLRRSRTASDGK